MDDHHLRQRELDRDHILFSHIATEVDDGLHARDRLFDLLADEVLSFGQSGSRSETERLRREAGGGGVTKIIKPKYCIQSISISGKFCGHNIGKNVLCFTFLQFLSINVRRQKF